jgi:tRNA (adenine22-N1)-methyltransferase
VYLLIFLGDHNKGVGLVLKERLGFIYSKVPQGRVIADIGTDHGYLPISLLKRGKCEKVIATDVKTGPLQNVSKNALKFGVGDQIEIRMGDGLEPIKLYEADVIIISGMGGALMSEILKQGLKKAEKTESLVLQPMNGIFELREFLYTHGFDIYEEGLCREDGKIYNVILARYDGLTREKSLLEIYVGEKLIQNQDPYLQDWIQRNLEIWKRIIEGMEKAQEVNRVELEKIKILVDQCKKLRV